MESGAFSAGDNNNKAKDNPAKKGGGPSDQASIPTALLGLEERPADATKLPEAWNQSDKVADAAPAHIDDKVEAPAVSSTQPTDSSPTPTDEATAPPASQCLQGSKHPEQLVADAALDEDEPVVFASASPTEPVKRRYKFADALPVAHDEADMSREAFERWSAHRCPSLRPPCDALIDLERELIYGDDPLVVSNAATSTHTAYTQAQRERGASAGRVVSPELWLYLTTRRGLRREQKLASTATTEIAPTRKSSRARNASSRILESDDLSSLVVSSARDDSKQSLLPPVTGRSALDAIEAVAEREVAVLLSEVESVALASAASSVQACIGQLNARVRREDDQVDGLTSQDVRLARLHTARDERIAALRFLARVDARIENLLAQDEQSECERLRRAAERANEADAMARRYRSTIASDQDRFLAAHDAIRAARSAADDVSLPYCTAQSHVTSQARHARQEVVSLREEWRRVRWRLYTNICAGVATPVQKRKRSGDSRKKPASSRSKKRRRGPAKRKTSSTAELHGHTRKNRVFTNGRDSSVDGGDDDMADELAEAELNWDEALDNPSGGIHEPSYIWEEPRRPRTLAIYDRRCRLHGTKPQCVEQSRRAVAAATVVEALASEVPQRLWIERRVSTEYVQRATALLTYSHERAYCSELRRRCSDLETEATMLFGADDDDTCANRASWDASVAASAAVLAAIDAVVTGEAKNALCAIRPPGHHAGSSLRALGAPTNGYCILNHAALGAKYAAHERGMRRVAVFDFDVHHGNGTEDILARTFDPSFLFVSIHAAGEDIFPGTGRLPENCLKDTALNPTKLRHRSSSISQAHRDRDGHPLHESQMDADDEQLPPAAPTERPHRSTNRKSSNDGSPAVYSPHPGVLDIPVEPPPISSDWLLRHCLPRVLAELEKFGPDLIVLSSGFDAHRRDPVNLGRLDASDYGVITRQVLG